MEGVEGVKGVQCVECIRCIRCIGCTRCIRCIRGIRRVILENALVFQIYACIDDNATTTLKEPWTSLGFSNSTRWHALHIIEHANGMSVLILRATHNLNNIKLIVVDTINLALKYHSALIEHHEQIQT